MTPPLSARPGLHPAGQTRSAGAGLLALAVAGVAAAWLVGFPAFPLALALLFIVAGMAVAWRPVLLMVLLPATLPVLDLAPWSGRRLLDEFDLLLLWLAALAWARLPRRATRLDPCIEAWALAALLGVMLVSAARVMLPWPAADLGDPGNPLSPLNALRLVKGGLQAAVVWALARRLAALGGQPGPAFGLGLVLGLAATVAVIVAERLSFSTLLDFSSQYRIAGPFAAMSLGGAYVECFLAAATPFLLAQLMVRATPLRLLAGAGLLTGTSYALMVTYSRGGYLAMAVGVAVMVLGPWLARQRQGQGQRGLVVAAMAGLAAITAYPVLTGAFAQARLNTVASDLSIREQHWAESLRLLGSDPLLHATGVGLGRYAETLFWAGPEGEQAGGHRLVEDPVHGTVLRLGAGFAYFVDQIVPLQPGAHYRLSYRLRPDGPDSALLVELCQKWLISSGQCTRGKPPAGAPKTLALTPGVWQTVTQDIVAPAAGPGRLPRPVRLSLHNEGRLPVAVDQVSLLSDQGLELVHNGGFAQGMDRWTFTSDKHLSWHAKSMLLGVYVELGALGVAAMLAVLMVGVWRAGLAALRGDAHGLALLAALAVFGVIGLIDTLVDTPRFLLLWLLLCLMPGTLVRAAAAPVRG